MQIPENCYKKTALPKAVCMSYEKFYVLAAGPDFPDPDGFYNGNPPACKEFPYWHIDTIKDWLNSLGEDLTAKSTNKAGCHMKNKTPWAIPAHDRNESIVSIRTRTFLKLMRVSA